MVRAGTRQLSAFGAEQPASLEGLAGFLVAWREFKYCPICDYEMLTWRETQVTCSKKCQGEYERRQRNYPVEEWGKLYQAGATYRQIAEKYRVSYAVVRRNTQKAGFPPRTDHEHLRKYDSPKSV